MPSVARQSAKKLKAMEIKRIYNLLKQYHDRYLAKHGVVFPRLKLGAGYTKDALTLVYLTQDYPNTRPVSKAELTSFIRFYYPNVNDVQQARHLGEQKGWYIAAGGRDNKEVHLERGDYQLVTLEKPYPRFHMERNIIPENWEQIKTLYDYRCATCGSKEGEANWRYPNTITRLQKGHRDPNKQLSAENVIPQCQKCNRPDRNNWVYDEKGRVVKLANPSVIKNSDPDVRWKVYKILYDEFAGRNPQNEQQ